MPAGESLSEVGKLTVASAIKKRIARRQRRTSIFQMGGARPASTTSIEAAPIGWNHITLSELGIGAELVGKAGNHAGLGQLRRRTCGIDEFVRRPKYTLRTPVRIAIVDAGAPVAIERVFNTATHSPPGTVTPQQLNRFGISVADKLKRRGNLVPGRGEVAEGNTASTVYQRPRCHEDAHSRTNAAGTLRCRKSNPREQRAIAGFVVDVALETQHEVIHLIIIPAMNTCENLSEPAVN